MQMAREWRNNGGIGIGDHRVSSVFESPSSLKLFPVSSPLPGQSSSPCSSLFGGVSVAVGVGGANYIEHTVSKFDTVAGIAIKYGVEVSDIKKINGLVSDLQMFALKTLHIPLPGRHPPSPVLANGLEKEERPRSPHRTPPRRRHSDLFESFQSLKLSSTNRKVSPAMNDLQGYYGLNSLDHRTRSNGCEMAVYQNGGPHHLEDGPTGKPSHCMNPPLGLHRKCKSVANGFKLEKDLADDGSVTDSDNLVSNLVRRRLKSEADFLSRAPEKLMKEDTSSGFSTVAGKGLALRGKAASRIQSGNDGEINRQSSITTAVGEFSVIDSLSGVKKSSSTSSLQDSENSSSIWATVNWSLKPDLQALSTATIARPIFDGLPKQKTSRKNKTALD